MKTNLKLIALLPCVILSFCKQPNNNEKHSVEGDKRHETHKTLKDQILGVLDISKDTIITFSYSKILLTTNFGKTWRDISNGKISYGIMIDNKHTLWVNNTAGVQIVPKYARFSHSKDFGKHWETIEWDPHKFWPMEFVSKPCERLTIKTTDNRIYQLVGDNAQTDWKYLDSVKDVDGNKEEHLPPYHIDSYWAGDGYMKLYKASGNKVDTLMRLDSLFNLNNMLKVKDTLYIAGSSGSTKRINLQAYVYAVINEKKLKGYPLPGAYATLVKGVGNRVWAFTADNVFLKEGDKFIKFY